MLATKEAAKALASALAVNSVLKELDVSGMFHISLGFSTCFFCLLMHASASHAIGWVLFQIFVVGQDFLNSSGEQSGKRREVNERKSQKLQDGSRSVRMIPLSAARIYGMKTLFEPHAVLWTLPPFKLCFLD